MPVGRHPGVGGLRRSLGEPLAETESYFEDCAANKQRRRSSSKVKTTCSPRSPISRRPKPDRREKRRISVVGRPSRTAARCSPTDSWLYKKEFVRNGFCTMCLFPYTNSAGIWDSLVVDCECRGSPGGSVGITSRGGRRGPHCRRRRLCRAWGRGRQRVSAS